MRPLAVLIGIVMGSAVSIAFGLLLTWIVLLFLPEHSDRFAGETVPLLRATALFSLTAAAAAASFYGEVRLKPWRFAAHASTLTVLALTATVYWPTR